MTPPPELTLYERPGCHLCEQALIVLQRVARDHAFVLRRVDIDADDTLLKAYLERIPVLALDGEELSDFFVDEPDLRARLLDRAPH